MQPSTSIGSQLRQDAAPRAEHAPPAGPRLGAAPPTHHPIVGSCVAICRAQSPSISSDHNAEIAAGASHTIYCRIEDVAARVTDITGGEGVDHIVEADFAANFPVVSQVLKSSWVVAVYALHPLPTGKTLPGFVPDLPP